MEGQMLHMQTSAVTYLLDPAIDVANTLLFLSNGMFVEAIVTALCWVSVCDPLQLRFIHALICSESRGFDTTELIDYRRREGMWEGLICGVVYLEDFLAADVNQMCLSTAVLRLCSVASSLAFAGPDGLCAESLLHLVQNGMLNVNDFYVMANARRRLAVGRYSVSLELWFWTAIIVLLAETYGMNHVLTLGSLLPVCIILVHLLPPRR